MGDLEARLGELVGKHQDRIWDYQTLLLGKMPELLKDRKLNAGVKVNLGKFLGTVSGSIQRENSSEMTSSDRLELAKSLLENGQTMTRMLQNDVGFVTQVQLLANEITQIDGEIRKLEELRERAESEHNLPRARELGDRIRTKKTIKK
jgi:hypothetical protein